jgi:hypothetical protein
VLTRPAYNLRHGSDSPNMRQASDYRKDAFLKPFRDNAEPA